MAGMIEYLQKQQEDNLSGATTKPKKMPLVVLLVGMAGTGKSTLAHRLNLFCEEHDKKSYFINLDPAVRGELNYTCNIDIRDTVDYKQVMSQYKLGPNGAIMTSLNLYATKFHQVISILEQPEKTEELDFIFVDTPGQIEVFTWSASGQLITESFASTFPTTILFIGDTSRCINPQTFMSMMLYASSILYRYQVPLLLALNKCDVVSGETAMGWIKDPDALSGALRECKGYGATLTASLALFIHEFYENMSCVPVSAVAGTGFQELVFGALPKAKDEYMNDYLQLIKDKMEQRKKQESDRMAADTRKLDKEFGKLSASAGPTAGGGGGLGSLDAE